MNKQHIVITKSTRNKITQGETRTKVMKAWETPIKNLAKKKKSGMGSRNEVTRGARERVPERQKKNHHM